MAAGIGWAAAELTDVESALLWASQQTGGGGTAAFSVLTAGQAEALDAMTSRILPAVDGRPGAREAGVIHFIDRALSTFNRSQRRLYIDGTADLNRRAGARWKDAGRFAALTAPQQDELLRGIETTPFFQAARFDTIVGMFALPSWGGNRDYAGWHLLGLAHQPTFTAPFGYYDAELERRG
jgi:gluconate 2-dehydrogenase gamma chain